jgi:glycosyltransferase involved in cell wall biosynthesis
MKIAVWHNLNSGGGKRALFYHIEGLSKRGHNIISFCPDTIDPSFLPLSTIIEEKKFSLKDKIAELKRSNAKKIYSYNLILERFKLMVDHCSECAKVINSSGFDVLLANSSSDFYMSHIGRFVNIPKAIYLGEPFRQLYEAFPDFHWKAPEKELRRFTSLNNIKNELRYWKKIYALGILAREELCSAKSYDLILVNSLYSRESLMRAYRLESKVCYLGIDANKFKAENQKKQNYVIGVGSFGHLKGIDRAIHCISKIPVEKRPELIWIGNFPDDEFIDSLNTLAKCLMVKFTPKYNVTDQELVKYLQNAAVMVYFPFLEPFGLAPLEANACGTAVIGIAEGGLKETIKNGYNGYIINDYDPNEISTKILNFTENLSFADKMGKEARKYVEEKWNYENGITNIEKYLSGLVKK